MLERFGKFFATLLGGATLLVVGCGNDDSGDGDGDESAGAGAETTGGSSGAAPTDQYSWLNDNLSAAGCTGSDLPRPLR